MVLRPAPNTCMERCQPPDATHILRLTVLLSGSGIKITQPCSKTSSRARNHTCMKISSQTLSGRCSSVLLLITPRTRHLVPSQPPMLGGAVTHSPSRHGLVIRLMNGAGSVLTLLPRLIQHCQRHSTATATEAMREKAEVVTTTKDISLVRQTQTSALQIQHPSWPATTNAGTTSTRSSNPSRTNSPGPKSAPPSPSTT
jgi:hypothetical protein